MSLQLIAGGAALLLAVGLVIKVGVLSLLSGGLHFLFARPRLSILKSELGDTGFAFGMRWNSAMEPAKFDRVKVRLFNPFGSPTQVDVSHEFAGQDETFATDVNMGEGLKSLMSATNLKDAMVEVEVMSLKGGITRFFRMKGEKFLEKMKTAHMSAADFNEKYVKTPKKPVFHQNAKSHIAESMPEEALKQLKIPTNPAFAADFAAQAGGGEAAAVENFAVTKVWIEDGCIVCDACEGIYPEVFEVQDKTCIIRPGAPLDNGLLIQEAAEACPVEVIKFAK